MGATWKAKTSALLIGLAAASILAAGCGSQEDPATLEDAASGGTEAALEASSNDRAVKDAGEENAKSGEPSADLAPSEEGSEFEIQPVVIPERNISLSPSDHGAWLRIGDQQQQFEWIFTTPRAIMPALHVRDYDQDGSEEIAVVLHVGSGTGVALDELHMVEFEGEEAKVGESAEGEGPFADHVFKAETYRAQMDKALAFKTSEEDGELFGHVTLDGTTTKVSLKQFQTGYDGGKVTDKLGFGAIVRFEAAADKLVATFAVGVLIDNVAEPQYFGEIHADVSYKDGAFQLSGFRFAADE